MDSLTEWKIFAKLVQSFAGERVRNDELRWAPAEYQDPSDRDSLEFLQLGRVAATLEHRIVDGTLGYRIRFEKRVEKGKMEVPGDGFDRRVWEVAPTEKSGYWSVRELGTDQ